MIFPGRKFITIRPWWPAINREKIVFYMQWSSLKCTRTLTLLKHTLYVMYTQFHNVYYYNFLSLPPIHQTSVFFRIQMTGYLFHVVILRVYCNHFILG